MLRKDWGGAVNLSEVSCTSSGRVNPADPEGLSSLGGHRFPPDAVCPQGMHASAVGHVAKH